MHKGRAGTIVKLTLKRANQVFDLSVCMHTLCVHVSMSRAELTNSQTAQIRFLTWVLVPKLPKNRTFL
jgi:hypothetical protein